MQSIACSTAVMAGAQKTCPRVKAQSGGTARTECGRGGAAFPRPSCRVRRARRPRWGMGDPGGGGASCVSQTRLGHGGDDRCESAPRGRLYERLGAAARGALHCAAQLRVHVKQATSNCFVLGQRRARAGGRGSGAFTQPGGAEVAQEARRDEGEREARVDVQRREGVAAWVVRARRGAAGAQRGLQARPLRGRRFEGGCCCCLRPQVRPVSPRARERQHVEAVQPLRRGQPLLQLARRWWWGVRLTRSTPHARTQPHALAAGTRHHLARLQVARQARVRRSQPRLLSLRSRGRAQGLASRSSRTAVVVRWRTVRTRVCGLRHSSHCIS